eukprot:501671-Rhodomonas_salina.3
MLPSSHENSTTTKRNMFNSPKQDQVVEVRGRQAVSVDELHRTLRHERMPAVSLLIAELHP